MLLGPVRFRYTAKEKAGEQGIIHFVVPRLARAVCPHGMDKMHVNGAYEIIRDNEVINRQIADDIKSCTAAGRIPVVLTRYTEYAATLYEMVKAYADNVFLLTGTKSRKEHKGRDELCSFR